MRLSIGFISAVLSASSMMNVAAATGGGIDDIDELLTAEDEAGSGVEATAMIDQTQWVYYGAVIAILGLFLAFFARR